MKTVNISITEKSLGSLMDTCQSCTTCRANQELGSCPLVFKHDCCDYLVELMEKALEVDEVVEKLAESPKFTEFLQMFKADQCVV